MTVNSKVSAGNGVFIPMNTFVGVSVIVGVGVSVGVAVFVNVTVGENVAVLVGDGVQVLVKLAVADKVGVGLTVGDEQADIKIRLNNVINPNKIFISHSLVIRFH